MRLPIGTMATANAIIRMVSVGYSTEGTPSRNPFWRRRQGSHAMLIGRPRGDVCQHGECAGRAATLPITRTRTRRTREQTPIPHRS